MAGQYGSLKEKIETLIAVEVEDKELPSISYTLVDGNETRASGHIQRHDLNHKFSDETRFRIASQTKMFTAICLMQLVERGLVDLNVPVSEYLPDFRPENPFHGNTEGSLGRDVTLRKLLSHTSGLIREPKSGHYLDDSCPPLSKTVTELGSSVLKNDPAAGVFSYSNAGIAVVGAVVERVSGVPYAEYLTVNLLTPLGMDGSAIMSNPEILAELAPACMWNLDGDIPAPVFDLASSPAGNLYATLQDMEKFMITLLRGGFTPDGQSIVSPSSLAQMWRIIGRRPSGYAGLNAYGLGFGVSELDGWLAVGHGGAVYGFGSQLSLLPQAGVGIVMISTLDGSNNVVNRLTESSLRLALAEKNMGNPPAPRRRYAEISQEQFETLPGQYRGDGNGEFVRVDTQNGGLYLIGDGMPLQIKPKSGNEFGIDGRLYGEGSDYAYLDLSFADNGKMQWKNQTWSKVFETDDTVPDPVIAPHIGDYGPDFNITTLSYENGSLMCLIEYFYMHRCEPLGGKLFKMNGTLYPSETLELDAVDENGSRGIRVGPMFLARRS
jgi:CubicO group peptidase (beta-lactamase class C family)